MTVVAGARGVAVVEGAGDLAIRMVLSRRTPWRSVARVAALVVVGQGDAVAVVLATVFALPGASTSAVMALAGAMRPRSVVVLASATGALRART